jgi:hypothetical protein
MADIRHEVQSAYAGVLDDWSDDDVRRFVQLLGAFNDSLESR